MTNLQILTLDRLGQRRLRYETQLISFHYERLRRLDFRAVMRGPPGFRRGVRDDDIAGLAVGRSRHLTAAALDLRGDEASGAEAHRPGQYEAGAGQLDLGRVGGGTPGRMTPGRWQIDLRDRSEKRLGAVTQQTPPAPAGLAEASGAFAFLGQRKVEEFRVHAGWVALCVIEADWKRTIHLVRLETGVHYPLGPGLMPRWARTRTN